MSGDKMALLLSHEDAMQNASVKMRISSKFRFRTATIKDIEHVQALERESWIETMQHEEKHLIMRLKTVPPRFFLLETLNDNGKWKILGVIQTQRINSVEDILRVHWTIEDSLYEANGKVLQLLRVNTYKKTNPKEGKGIPTGALLRDFCITYAKELHIKTVCAVTRTTDFINAKDSNGSNGLIFHISRGATIHKAIEKWRPQDVDNDGYGVLIAYDVFHLYDTMDKGRIVKYGMSKANNNTLQKRRIISVSMKGKWAQKATAIIAEEIVVEIVSVEEDEELTNLQAELVWTGILEAEEEDMEDAAEDFEPDSNEIGEGDVEKESDEEDTEEKEVSEETVNDDVDEAIDTSLSKEEDQDNEATENDKDQNEEEGEEKDGISKETVLKWKELTDEISEIAILLETAVEKEEYDEAAEFNEKLEIMKADIDGLGFSDDEFQAALEAMDLSSD